MSNPVRHMHAMLAATRSRQPDRAEVHVPEPGRGELLVQVRATALTAGELDWPETWPAIPCHDLSGVVAAVGAGVTGWQPGDEVYALVGFDRPGAAAEYVTVPAADVAAKPAAVEPRRGGRGPARRAHRLAGPAHPGQRAARPARPGPRRGRRGRRLRGAARRPAGAVVTATASARDPDVRGRPRRQPGHRLRRPVRGSGPRRRHRRRPGWRRRDGRVLGRAPPRRAPGGDRRGTAARTPAAGPM